MPYGSLVERSRLRRAGRPGLTQLVPMEIKPPQSSGWRSILHPFFTCVRSMIEDLTRVNSGRLYFCRAFFSVVFLALLVITLILVAVVLMPSAPSPDVREPSTFMGEAVAKRVQSNTLWEVCKLFAAQVRANGAHVEESLKEFLLRCQQEPSDHTGNISTNSHMNNVEDAARNDSNVGHDTRSPPQFSEGSVTKPGANMTLMSDSPFAERRDISEVMDELRLTVNFIMAHDPDGGLEHLANFMKKRLSPARVVDERGPETTAATSDWEETEAFQPFDEILYLQLSSFFAKHGNEGSITTRQARLWWRQKAVEVSSVVTGRFYYPLRRFHRAQQYSSETADTVNAWLSAMMEDFCDEEMEPLVSPPSSSPKRTLRQAGGNEQLLSRGENILKGLKTNGYASIAPPNSKLHTASIFVNVASYRDEECWPTVRQSVERAANMFRVYFGIAEQHLDTDLSCVSYDMLLPEPCTVPTDVPWAKNKGFDFDGAICFPVDNIRRRQIAPAAAYGPTYGRFVAMLLYRGEDYAFVLDSHTRFVFAWDSRITAMYMEMDHPRLVLSHYPEGYNTSDTHFNYERASTVYLCRASFVESDGYIRLDGIVISESEGSRIFRRRFVRPYASGGTSPEVYAGSRRPLPQPWAAGGFLFANASIMREVPFDPHLPNTFNGEEVLYSVRLWTHGYDIHSPKRSICYHIYTRKGQPKVWENNTHWEALRQKSRQRIQYLLQSRVKGTSTLLVPLNTTDPVVVVDKARYGMGRLRSVDAWYNFSGVNSVDYTVDGRWCGKK
uniref:WGS project CAEQ00000000 data, annotated contig 1759 n=1 Tax=Trypanosoma congolense (strain IL3000) TaxID=1068625 RepID=F9W8Q2_TRYCI|nr:unnamed protein product [Trypanosoma congolense IL3000]